VLSPSTSLGLPSSSPAAGDPQAEPAVAAYLRFLGAVSAAEMRPPALGHSYGVGEDFSKYSFDPLLSEMAVYVAGLSREGQAFEGTPSRPRVTVVAVNMLAKPYPVVLLSSCPTSEPTWTEYVIASGKVVPFAPAKALPPYRVAVKMIYSGGHWGVQMTTPDVSTTCTA
jgi:hypothetical protein